MNKSIGVIISLVRNAFCIKRHVNNWAQFKYFQVLTHVQTTCESPDLNSDFRLVENWFSYTDRYLSKNMTSTIQI